MCRKIFILVLVFTSISPCLSSDDLEGQVIPLSEVSGAVNIGDNRLLLIADEGYQVQLVSKAEDTFAAGDFKNTIRPVASTTNGSKEGKKIVDDIEDVAWDKTQDTAFVITSHSRSKKQDQVADPKLDKPERHKLARLMWKTGRIETKEIDVLGEALKEFSFVREAMQNPPQEGGNGGTFNIEGLAFEPPTDQQKGQLLIGLRSPTQEHNGKPCAVVLVLKNPHELFDTAALPKFEPRPQYLDLGGLGIRGMTYDAVRHGWWIIAGRSADSDLPSDHVLPSLWFWAPSKPDNPLRKAKVASLEFESLESVSLLSRDSKPGLLLINDDGEGHTGSRYVWIPIPELIDSNNHPINRDSSRGGSEPNP